MCGIFCSLSSQHYITPDSRTRQLLQNRGPDSTGEHQSAIDVPLPVDNATSSRIYATFFSTVLSLRGRSVVEQPLIDKTTGSVLCWNGEAWSINGHAVTDNDSCFVFSHLLDACRRPAELSSHAIIGLLSSIRGPYAFVFYDAANHCVYYARDCLGRRSLLRKSGQHGALVLSSVCDNTTGQMWEEVEADGVYVIDLKTMSPTQDRYQSVLVPHCRRDQSAEPVLSFTLPFPALNRFISTQASETETQVTDRLRVSLQKSLQLRIQHVREAVQPDEVGNSEHQARVAILFSGGLDCTILARICHNVLPLHHTIDLLNVAFENPRIHGKLDLCTSPYEVCPDRITGRASHAELMTVCPDRIWRFVEINVPYSETQAHRNAVVTLMHPHNTEMDLSISYALYFASRGTGVIHSLQDSMAKKCSTTAHVLLSGLGADELFGGYQRHATAFSRRGYPGLLDELELDFDRLGKRNLGRDDRIISDCGREVRFPYLDEHFIALALELPVMSKCDFHVPHVESSPDPAQSLEPGKRALRLLAWQLGMKRVATEKKRAIQFGSRTAKMETGKTKGTHMIP